MSMQENTEGESLTIAVGKRRATLKMDGKRVATLDVQREPTVTTARARELASDDNRQRLIVLDRSSPDARKIFRRSGVSYAAANGELFVHLPPIHVERPGRRRTTQPTVPTAPFAIRSSRVPRWLLLHSDAHSTVRELATAVKLSEAMVSRTVHALAGDGLIEVEIDPDDARRRKVRLRNSSKLLEAFELASAARRPRRITWDIGARSADEAMERVQTEAGRQNLRYALSGLAGAALIRRVVEPADAAILLPRDEIDQWGEALLGTPSRPGPGTVTAIAMPDPFILNFGSSIAGLWVADPVQLYLDCRKMGERALDAAEAIRSEMHW